MNELFWKDYRVNRLILIIGVVLLLGPVIVGVIGNAVAQVRHDAYVQWFEVVVQAGTVSLCFSLITMLLLGGNAFAGERADRSAEFMAYLPPTRRAKLASKVLLAVPSVTIILLTLLMLCYVIAPMCAEPTENMARMRGEMVSGLLPTALLMFAAAWCASSAMSSTTYAVGIGFAAPWLLYCVLAILHYWVKIESLDVGVWYIRIAIVLTVLGFAGGCILYLRRVEP